MRRRGFALAAVLFALVLLAAVTAGGFFASLQEARTGRNAAALVRARTAAESAIAGAIAGWDPAALNGLAVGGSAPVMLPPVPGLSLVINVTRLDPRLFVLRAAATDSGGRERVLAAVVRLDGIELLPRAAARVRSADSSAAALMDGVDRAPAGWACPATGDTVPPLLVQPAASDSQFFRFGTHDWAWIAAWAAAAGPGADSLPVRYVAGDLVLGAGRTLGVLVVDGDLTLGPGAEIVGIVVVRRAMVVQGSGVAIAGGVVASQLIVPLGFTQTMPLVSYSSCAVLAASLALARPEHLRGQPVAPMY